MSRQPSGGRESVRTQRYGRSLEWLYLKNTPATLLIRTFPGHMLYNAIAAAHFARLGLLGTFIRAKAAACAGLPRMLRKRAKIQRGRRVGAKAIRPHLERQWLSMKRREKRFDIGLGESQR